MNLREQALEAARIGNERNKQIELAQAGAFAVSATRKFRSAFQVEKQVTFVPVSRTVAITETDGVKVEAREEYEAIEFYAVVPCPLCGDEGYKKICTLADLGNAIEQGWTTCSCTMALPFEPVGAVLEEAESVLPDILEALHEHNRLLDLLVSTFQNAEGPDGAIRIAQ